MSKSTLLLFFVLCCFTFAAKAQYNSGPRLFLDIPSLYIYTPDAENVGEVLGAGTEIAMNVATHWGTVRGGGGLTFTMNPKSNELQETFNTTPYIVLEAGAGRYRSNGNQCAKTKQNAFTYMAKAGVRYDFYTGDAREVLDKTGAVDYTVGAEFGYFFIRDVFRNTELVLSANYLTKAEAVAATFGFKFFLNLKADRDR
jgi:hypothetical protein